METKQWMLDARAKVKELNDQIAEKREALKKYKVVIEGLKTQLQNWGVLNRFIRNMSATHPNWADYQYIKGLIPVWVKADQEELERFEKAKKYV